MPHTIDVAQFASTKMLWDALTQDTGCSAFICNRDGQVIQYNERARAWFQWKKLQHARDEEPHEHGDGFETTQAPFTLADSCYDPILSERMDIVHRVCDEHVHIVYESVLRGIRNLVSIRPLPIEETLTLAFIISRRLKPWERVTQARFPDAEVVELELHDAGILQVLSPRELEVLVLIGDGHSYAEIARQLHRSVRTVERHRDHLGQKLGANNRVELARFAIRAGICELPDPADAVLLSEKPYDPLDISKPLRDVVKRRKRRQR